MPELRALIFDLDGTLVDSMPAHLVAWQQAMATFGLTLSEEEFYATAGWSTPRIVERIAQAQGRSVDVEAASRAKDDAYLHHVAQVRLIEPVMAVVREHHGRLPLAIGTGNRRRVVEATLEVTGIASLFDAIVTADDVQRHKPAPDTFLEAARRLGVPPSECRVYEDGDPGIEAARAAGMDVVDIRDWS